MFSLKKKKRIEEATDERAAAEEREQREVGSRRRGWKNTESKIKRENLKRLGEVFREEKNERERVKKIREEKEGGGGDLLGENKKKTEREALG
mgnify:FL=1